MRLFLIVIFYFLVQTMMAQQVLPLYSDIIPNAKSDASVIEKSEIGSDGILRISDVTIPTLTVYLPKKEKTNGTAVIICPGGGYWILATGHEGEEVAKEFVKIGVTAFVLKYRLPDSRTQLTPEVAPLQDAQKAIQLIRERAEEWKLDPTKIGVLGFSAGGHLASTLGTKFNKSLIENRKRISLRPDFIILIYPVISSDPTIAHGSSFDKLLGSKNSDIKREEYSSEKHITNQTPPTFLIHASDDDGVSPSNSVVFYQALLKNKISAEMHLYQKGGHGFGLKNPTTEDVWFDRLQNWMKTNNWL